MRTTKEGVAIGPLCVALKGKSIVVKTSASLRQDLRERLWEQGLGEYLGRMDGFFCHTLAMVPTMVAVGSCHERKLGMTKRVPLKNGRRAGERTH